MEQEHLPAQALWDKHRQEVESITDRLGKGVDNNIQETVTALQVFGFPTSQSCEGHVGEEESHGATFPWVEIYAPEPAGWQSSQELKDQWKSENMHQRQKLSELLKEFYRNRTAGDERLVFHDIGIFGGFRVQSAGVEAQSSLSPQEQLEKLALYRREINDFTAFLRSKFFG